MPARPTLTLHVCASLDGFIARPDNSVAWLEGHAEHYAAGVADDAIDHQAVLDGIDCYVLGSRTYEHALELGWVYGDKPVVVLTSRALTSERETVEFHSGDLARLVDDVLAPRFRDVWLVGGARLCQDFLARGLVDKLVLMTAPITLGDGLRLFGRDAPEQRWRLTDVTAFRNGFVELSYAVAPAPR